MVFRSTRPQQTGQGTKNRTWSTTFQAWDAATTPYPASWSGREDLNLQSPVSETGGLPLPHVLNLERHTELESVSSAWKAEAQPIYQCRPKWSGQRESDPRPDTGNVGFCH